jgi:DNA-binding transcriptional regulator/RsmH inhibitor MraZ
VTFPVGEVSDHDRHLIVETPRGGSERHHLDNEGRLVLPAELGTAKKVSSETEITVFSLRI